MRAADKRREKKSPTYSTEVLEIVDLAEALDRMAGNLSPSKQSELAGAIERAFAHTNEDTGHECHWNLSLSALDILLSIYHLLQCEQKAESSRDGIPYWDALE